jgi:Tfp pilus assembly protein PilO
MFRSFSVASWRARLAPKGRRDLKTVVRFVLGLLVALNVAAAVLVFRPIGGSPEDLQRQLSSLRGEIQQKQAALGRMKIVSAKIEKGRAESDSFLNGYFLNERTAYLTVLEELNRIAKETKIKVKEHTFVSEPIEGSSDLSMLTVNGNIEGAYADLIEFVNRIDRSDRLIILESLQAQPLQTAGVLNVQVKLNAFVREAKPL